MSVHVGQVLRELYLGSGLKMERFAAAVAYSPKTIYYHFTQDHLHTETLQQYEEGLAKLGRPVDIFELLSRKRSGKQYDLATPGSVVSEPPPPAYAPPAPETAADLLRRAAELLDKERSAPAPNRDKEQP